MIKVEDAIRTKKYLALKNDKIAQLLDEFKNKQRPHSIDFSTVQHMFETIPNLEPVLRLSKYSGFNRRRAKFVPATAVMAIILQAGWTMAREVSFEKIKENITHENTRHK